MLDYVSRTSKMNSAWIFKSKFNSLFLPISAYLCSHLKIIGPKLAIFAHIALKSSEGSDGRMYTQNRDFEEDSDQQLNIWP